MRLTTHFLRKNFANLLFYYLLLFYFQIIVTSTFHKNGIRAKVKIVNGYLFGKYYLGKFYQKGDKSLRKAGFKTDYCDLTTFLGTFLMYLTHQHILLFWVTVHCKSETNSNKI